MKPKAKTKDAKSQNNNPIQQLLQSSEQDEANESARYEENARQFEDLANEENGFNHEIDLTSNEWLDVEPGELQKRYDIIRRYVRAVFFFIETCSLLSIHFRQSAKLKN